MATESIVMERNGIKKEFRMQRTLYHGEYKKFMNTMGAIADLSPLVRSESVTPQQIQDYASKVAKLRSEDYDDCEKAVMECYGLTQEDVDKMFEADVLYLFSEVFIASRDVKKKSPSLSVSG